MNRIITIAALLLIGFSTSFAQPMKWKKLANRILTVYDYGFGPVFSAIKARDNVILAGWENVVLSIDTGITWTALGAFGGNSQVESIDIYDKNTFAVGTANGLFYSSDQGRTWNKLFSGLVHSVIFDNSPDKMICIIDDLRKILLINSTSTSKSIPIQYIVSDLQRGADNAYYTKGGDVFNSLNTLLRSTDNGNTWQTISQVVESDFDCYTFICDKTDPMRFLIVNEDWADRTDGQSQIFVTSNAGISWTTTLSKPIGSYTYLLGNSTQGCNDYFVGSYWDRILRSPDKGMTWQSIGGPKTPVDSKSLFAVDDSTIYAIDDSGSIWVTDAARSTGFVNESIADIYTDTLGGDVVVPINFKSSVDINAEFVLQFDTSDLVYKGTFDSYNIDHTISINNGTARIRYNPAQDSELYAHFSFFPTDSNCTKVTIDSLIPADNSSSCASRRSLTATICGPEGCGINALSRFIRFGTKPEFRIAPNPTHGRLSLFSDTNVEDAKIEVVNDMGAVVLTTRSTIYKASPLQLEVSALPSGPYILKITTGGGSVSTKFIKSE